MTRTTATAKRGILRGLVLCLSFTPAGSAGRQDLSAKTKGPCDRSPLVITRATLWTTEGQISNAEVLLSGGRVTAIGKSGKVARPAGAEVIDAAGDMLLPGLIDAHAHLVFPGSAPKEFLDDPLRKEFLITGKQLLRSGVTSARIHLWDLVDGPAFRRETEDDCFPAPRLQIGGPGFLGGAPELNGKNVWGIKDAEDIRRKIERVKSVGAQWIAVHDLEKFTPGQLGDLVAEARRAGLRVMAAGETPVSIQRALEIGADSIEYLDRTSTEAYSTELIARMKERGRSLFLVPPIGYFHRYVEFRRNERLLDNPIQIEFMPDALSTHLLNNLRAERTRSSQPSSIERSFPTFPNKFRQLYDAGLNVAVGSDCGSPANFQTNSIWWELETWRKLGVAPAEAIRGATTRGAALLQTPDIGNLKAGMRADFVIYKGNITSGSFEFQRVRYVGKSGVLFVRDGRWVGP